MTACNQLPPYFQKYLDQRFTVIEIQLNEIKSMLDGLTEEVGTNTNWRQNITAKLAVVATIGSFVLTLLVSYVKEVLKRL